MRGLALVAEQLILDRIMTGSSALSASNKAVRDLGILSGFFAVIGLGFLVFASYLWLQAHYTPDVAAAVTGGLLILLAIMMAAGALTVIHYRQSGIRKVRMEINEAVHEALNTIEDLLAEPVGHNPKTAVTAASVAGYMAGKRFL